MKKISFLVFFFLVCLFFTGSRSHLTAVSAQAEVFDGVSAAKADYDLAATVKRLTNRSTDGLVRRNIRGGEFMVDLQNRFQNVMLAQIGAKGDATAACVTSLDEANAFFGRNLETGADLSFYQNQYRKDDAATLAALHGMSEQEYKFYTNLIDRANRQKLASPNSATISIFNADGATEGFNDATLKAAEGGNNGATLGAQRLNLFSQAANIWGGFLDSNVTIVVNSNFDDLSCSPTSGVLGSAGAGSVHGNFANVQFTNTFYHVALANKVSGSDLNGATAEINARFNSLVNNNAGCLGGNRFYYGYDNTTPAGTINLLVVLLHEMGHGLGFSSFVNGTSGALLGGIPDIFSIYMYDRSTGKYWSQMTDAERQASALNTGNVLWDGANVKIASGFLTAGRDAATGRVQLFTPNPLQPGSSISHFDTAAATNSMNNLLMEPVINIGLAIDLDLTRQQMRDIGWFRDTTADLAADTIINVQPSGSATLNTLTSRTLTWTNVGGFNRNVTVELSTDGGATYSILTSNIANTGSYTFTVPYSPTTQGRFRVREYDFAAPSGISSSNFTIAAPTAAPVSVSGRVTDATGRGISGAQITVNGSGGAVFYARSNPFGFYAFEEIESGATYVFQVSHKRYAFAPRVINLTEDLNDLNFTVQ